MECTEVRPKLYLGTAAAKQLTLLGVSHILSLSLAELELDEKQLKKRKVDGRSTAGRTYLQHGGKKDPFVRLLLPKDLTGHLAQHVDETRLFISEGLAQGKVLVQSEAVALLVAFLMQKEKLSLGKALLGIKEKSEVKLGPLVDELRSLEEELGLEPASPATLEASGVLKKELASTNPKVFLEICVDGQASGRLEFELFADLVPRTCENFRCLCTGEQGRGQSGKRLTYLGSVFHCVIPGLVAIGGDITQGDGTGGESIYGYAFADESFEVKHDGPGILSMANSGPDSNGSQFLICFTASPQLDGKNVAFGRALSTEMLQIIEACGSEKGETSKRVTILDCGEVPQPGCVVKRQRVMEVVTVLQLLRKHKECKKATSWREEVITCSRTEAADALQHFRKELQALASSERRRRFEVLARQHSDCKSAKKGGLLDPFERGMMNKTFEEAAFALGPGELSEVFSTKQGEHLLLRL